jgi:hypothetical protein
MTHTPETHADRDTTEHVEPPTPPTPQYDPAVSDLHRTYHERAERRIHPHVEPEAPLTWEELCLAGQLLHLRPNETHRETLEQFRERLQERWRFLRRIVGE